MKRENVLPMKVYDFLYIYLAARNLAESLYLIKDSDSGIETTYLPSGLVCSNRLILLRESSRSK